MRLIACFLGLMISTQAASQPISGSLNSSERDFLRYECNTENTGILKCDFTQVMLSRKQSPDEVDGLIEKQLPEAMQEFSTEDIEETCTLMSSLSSFSEAVLAGEIDAARRIVEKMPEAMGSDFDLDEAIRGFDRLHPREIEDLRALWAAFDATCKAPEPVNIEALLRLQIEKDVRTCTMWINKWSDKYRQISQSVWAVETDGPSGQCGVQRLDRFVCERGSFSCEYVFEQRVLIPDAEPVTDIPCSELDERPILYESDGDGIYLDCEIVSFF